MDLAVHHKSVFLIVYPGGYCGEFLAWLLGQHANCIPTGVQHLGKNRYSGVHTHNYVHDNKHGTKDFLFLVAHPGTATSKTGLPVHDINQFIFFYASSRTHRFYFMLYLAKTVFYKYYVTHPPIALCPSPDRWAEFVRYLGGRTEFSAAEIDCWLNDQPHSVDSVVSAWWDRLGTPRQSLGANKLDIDTLFFQDPESGYMDMCNKLKLTPNPDLVDQLIDYHQRNVTLVESRVGMPVDQFLDLPEPAALAVMQQAFAHNF